MSDQHTIKVEISELPHFRFNEPYRCNLKVRRDFMISVSDRSNDISYLNCINVSDLISRFNDDCQYCLNNTEDSESCKRFMEKYLIKKESPDGNYKIRGVTLDHQIGLRLVQDECESKILNIKKNGCKACPYCQNGECLRSVETLEIVDMNTVHEDCPLHIEGEI